MFSGSFLDASKYHQFSYPHSTSQHYTNTLQEGKDYKCFILHFGSCNFIIQLSLAGENIQKGCNEFSSY